MMTWHFNYYQSASGYLVDSGFLPSVKGSTDSLGITVERPNQETPSKSFLWQMYDFEKVEVLISTLTNDPSHCVSLVCFQTIVSIANRNWSYIPNPRLIGIFFLPLWYIFFCLYYQTVCRHSHAISVYCQANWKVTKNPPKTKDGPV